MEKFEEFIDIIDILSKSLEKYKENKDILVDKIENLNKQNEIELDNITIKMRTIIDSIDGISAEIEELQYEIDKNEINITQEIKDRIKEYEQFEKFKKVFEPYMLIYMLGN